MLDFLYIVVIVALLIVSLWMIGVFDRM